MAMRGTFRFHPVGQGLFYSGLIQKTTDGNFRQFSFVYDCGSTSSHRFLRREVDDFKELLPLWKNGKKRLDLLVVSRLHDDHVNGLEYLLRDVEVDTVIMPFMEQELQPLAWTESPGQESLRDFYAGLAERSTGCLLLWHMNRMQAIKHISAPGTCLLLMNSGTGKKTKSLIIWGYLPKWPAQPSLPGILN